MRKKFALLFAAVMTLAAVFTGCGKKTENEDGKKIGVIQLVENGAFNDMKDGIVEKMKEKGYSDIDVKCAQGDASALQTIAQNMADGSYDLVFTIATPSTQAMVNLETETPVFFCSVSAPVAAGVLTDMSKPDKNATGTSNAIPVDEMFKMTSNIGLDIKTVGFIYCTSEDNSVNTVKTAKAYCDDSDIKYEEVSVTSSADVEQAVNTLIDKGIDAVFIPNDSVIQSAMSVVTEIARDRKVPVIGSSATMVVSGCLATVAIGDKEIGIKTAEMALEYLEGGKKVEKIPAVVVPASQTVINKTTADAIGLAIPDDKTFVIINDAE